MTFKLSGMVLGVDGVTQSKLDNFPGSTSLLVDLSARIVPSIEQAILDPMKHQVCCLSWNSFCCNDWHLQRVYLQSPALRRDADGSVFVVARADTRHYETDVARTKHKPLQLNKYPTNVLWNFRLNASLDVIDIGE
jgi:hypothetical protein